jgi:hypothetical protein
VMGIMCVVCGTRMLSDKSFPHKLIGQSPANEHLFFAIRICGHKKMVCIVTEKMSVITFLQ